MLPSIEKYKKYKSDKKVQKEIEKHQLSIEAKRTRALQKCKDDIMSKYEKQQARFNSRANRQLEKKIRQVIWRKPLKKKEPSMKQKAFREFQLLMRLVNADDDGHVTLVDTGQRVHYTKCDAGHYYPKKNYPHLAFEGINCYPISKNTNKLQGDNVGIRWREQLLNRIGQEEMDKLDALANDQKAKSEVLDNNYYRKMYDWFKVGVAHYLNKLKKE